MLPESPEGWGPQLAFSVSPCLLRGRVGAGCGCPPLPTAGFLRTGGLGAQGVRQATVHASGLQIRKQGVNYSRQFWEASISHLLGAGFQRWKQGQIPSVRVR